MAVSTWAYCCEHLQNELSRHDFDAWIRPLHAIEQELLITLLAPNQFVRDKVRQQYLDKMLTILQQMAPEQDYKVTLEVGSQAGDHARQQSTSPYVATTTKTFATTITNNLSPLLTFDNFIEGKSNQLGRAAALQVAESPGKAYNPLLIYGEVGLGKTHLMQAIGWAVMQQNPTSRIIYLHSERFVNDMVTALRTNSIRQFKDHYRSMDVLLIDDIQFFAGKDRSQEEFFHTFNTLLEGNHQIILTCDRYPKEVDGIEERLKSRFSWGLTVAIEPPELETRVAILNKKSGQRLPSEVAFFIAKRFRSNVRELEGALNRVIAFVRLKDCPITIDSTKEALQDMLRIQDRQISVTNIQKTTSEYYKIRLSDLLSKRRNRTIARPRQIAMALCKELTSHSLPEIGEAFGGRDHTTVLHACRKIDQLKKENQMIAEDYKNLTGSLTN